MKFRMIKVVFLLLVLWGAILLCNGTLEKEKSQEVWQKERVSAVVTSPDIVPFLLGFETVFADYLWIRTILYFGENYNGAQDLEWLRAMIDAVLMLNPPFFPPYEFAGVMVPEVSNDWEFARKTLELGVSRVEQRSQYMLFTLAYIYYTHYNDYFRAADILFLAAQSPGAPAFWGRLAATLYSRAGQEDQGILFLVELYESTDNPQIKESLKKKIMELTDTHQKETTYE